MQQSSERRERIRKLEDGITELSAHIYAATFRYLFNNGLRSRNGSYDCNRPISEFQRNLIFQQSH